MCALSNGLPGVGALDAQDRHNRGGLDKPAVAARCRGPQFGCRRSTQAANRIRAVNGDGTRCWRSSSARPAVWAVRRPVAGRITGRVSLQAGLGHSVRPIQPRDVTGAAIHGTSDAAEAEAPGRSGLASRHFLGERFPAFGASRKSVPSVRARRAQMDRWQRAGFRVRSTLKPIVSGRKANRRRTDAAPENALRRFRWRSAGSRPARRARGGPPCAPQEPCRRSPGRGLRFRRPHHSFRRFRFRQM